VDLVVLLWVMDMSEGMCSGHYYYFSVYMVMYCKPDLSSMRLT